MASGNLLRILGRRSRLLQMALLALGLLCFAITPVRAQEPSSPAETENVVRVHVDLVQEDVEVFAKRTGRPVDGLQKEDFLVEEDGRQARIAGVSRDEVPFSVVLLVDQTDTVRPVLAKLATGALQALRHLKAQDEIAVMAYSSSTELMRNFTLDHELVAEAIQRASTGGSRSPAFYNEAIFNASSLLQNGAKPGNRRIIIWLTDNVPDLPNGRVHTERQAFQQAFSAFVVITALVERSGLSEVLAVVNKNPLVRTLHRHDPAGDVYRYVDRTGGDVTRADKDEVSTKLAELIDGLRTRYSISYYPATREPQQCLHRVTVSVQQDGHKRKDLVVRAPQGYYR